MTLVRGALIALMAASAAGAAEPDGLVLPPNFHATVIADGIKGLRHLAVRPDGDIYASTRGGGSTGIVAIHLDRNGKMAWSRSFGTVTGGTGIRLHKGWLYASTPTALYRYQVSASTLVPTGEAEPVVEGFPSDGFLNRVIAFDDKGGVFVGVGGVGNICADMPPEAKPVGRQPCPDIATRSGVWRFPADRAGQHFPADGERYVTGLRDLDAMDWRTGDALYGAMQNRNGTNATWPTQVSAADEAAIGDDMYRFLKGADLGWPYTYFDSANRRRMRAPEYGGGEADHARTSYATPVAGFPSHAAPLDLLFYRGRSFPAQYRGGAFVALHGGSGPDTPEGRNGYSVVFVKFDKAGQTEHWTSFADGFAGATPASRTVSRAAYRPVGLAEAPDGSLYIADSVKGRIWRITYGAS